ncbi:MAG TPA: RnfH family protein [Steroidobacteraceae bacterium]|nr:RnfH family protein [Steroidobacteraceae bacterium]
MGGREKPSPALSATSPTVAGEVTRGGKVEVVYALPDRQRRVEVDLPPGGLTAGQAVERSGLLQAFPDLVAQTLVLGIFGTVCEAARPLRDGDRVEIYRPLKHDPRAMRRERAAAASRKGRPR